MWGRLLAFIQAYFPRDLIETSVFLLCSTFTLAALAMTVDCHWYLHLYPGSPVTGRCGEGARKDFLEAMTTLVTLLIAFLSGKRNGINQERHKHDDDDTVNGNKFQYKDDDED